MAPPSPENPPTDPPQAPAAPSWSRLGVALSDIKLAHSVFALPFAVLGVFLAAPGLEGVGARVGGVGWSWEDSVAQRRVHRG